ncbi:MAG: M3 family metallopeptidase [Verrucomicrobiota bacterium]
MSLLLRFLFLCPLAVIQAGLPTLSEFEEQAEEFGVRLSLPEFPADEEGVAARIDEVIAGYTAVGDEIAALADGERTFENTVGALDGLEALSWNRLSAVNILENASPEAALREVAQRELLRFEEFAVSFGYREDIYRSVRAYAETEPVLELDQKRLLNEVLVGYRQQGFELRPEKRAQVEALKKELSRATNDFSRNIRESSATVILTAEELRGVPENLLAKLKTGQDEYTVQAQIAWQLLGVLQNARSEEVRREVYVARSTHAMELNVPVLTEMVLLRTRIANLLGYPTWADYKTESRMAGSEQVVREFLSELNEGLAPKFEEELAVLRQLKVRETGQADAQVEMWDVPYFRNVLQNQQFQIDQEALRAYFPYEPTLEGMFAVYEEIFGLEIRQMENPNPWHPEVTLYGVIDSETGKPMGLFYLDMFPREGKYNHFAQFGIIGGKLGADGIYQRPTVALICNFPPPSSDEPSLLSFDNVETLFHEFGHVMHSVLTEARYASHACTSVPRDFVEMPSQVLEYWVTDKATLDTFAADYRDSSQKIPEEVLENLQAAELATVGIHYRRQINYALVDLLLHTYAAPEQVTDVALVGNRVAENVYLPPPEGTAYVAGFGHLTHYDAGYYGYAWADVISADLADYFESSEKGFLNPELGRRLRHEILAKGDSRSPRDSIRAFLGRDYSITPFLKKIGVEAPTEAP